jgi:LuxR family maltose regulon positive regulatory protein
VIINGVTDVAAEIVLVLDDYHVIEHPDVHASVRYVLENAPDRLRVVLITRADPPLLLARTRARGALTEIRAAELRFRSGEAAELLRETTGAPLPDDAITTLTARTEGWAAGLHLAGLSLEGRDDIGPFLESFSGSHRFVLDYLTEEVLDRQPPEMREFLLRSSILQRLSGPLCDAVTGGTGSQELLETGERANLFLVALDDERRWWRFHHLFADLLRVRLQQRPELARELHRRAAGWHESHGVADEAVRHALAAGDPAWAGRLIERNVDELLLRREGATLQRQLAELPEDAPTSRRLALAQARSELYAGHPGRAEELIGEAATAGADDLDDEPFVPSVARAASPLTDVARTELLLRAFVFHLRGRADEAAALAERTLDEIADTGSALGLIAGWHLATAPWLRGEVDVAEPALASNIERWRAAGDHDRAAWGAHYLGRIQRERGDLDAALGTYRDVLGRDAIDAGADSPASGIAHIGVAEVAYQRNELEAAQRHVTAGIARCRHFVYTQALSTGLSTLALLLDATGDPMGARATMAEAIECGPDAEVVDLLNPVPVQRARLLLAQGDPGPAAEWVARRRLGPNDDPRHVLEPAHLLLARLLTAQGRADEASRLLDRLRRRAIDDGRSGSLVEIDVLRALASDASDRRADALATLAGAVALAAPQGYVRVFVDEGEAMASLLGRLVAAPAVGAGADVNADRLAALVRALEGRPRQDAAHAGGAAHRLVVPLTERELEVLQRIAAGKQNKDIAAELYISLNTVKKHVTHIFDKLGVSNRTSAVARARDLDLLS